MAQTSCLNITFNVISRLTDFDHAEVLNPQGRVISGFYSDVYSLGIVIWEIVSGEWPFHNRTTMQILSAVGINKETPAIPENTNSSIIYIMHRCWNAIPESRVTMQELESYVTSTMEFNPDVSISVPVSDKNVKSAKIYSVPGAIEVCSLHDLHQEKTDDNGYRNCAQTEPQNHYLAEVPELGEAWPLES